jgi:hypothetical protein
MATFKDLNLLDIGNTIQLTGALWEGKGKCYLVFLPNEHDSEAALEPLMLTSDEWNRFIRQTDLLETEVLAQASGKIAKVILRKTSRQIAQTVSWEVYARDGFRCRYCGVGPGVPLTVDHLVLWEEGGPSTHANLVSACKKCNRTRGNTQYQKWLKHPYYQRVSKGLSPEQREANQALAGTLENIPKMLHKPSKRK